MTTIYVIDCDHGVKVGITRMGPEMRMADLRRASGLLSATYVRTWELEDDGQARLVERGAHWLLRETRTVGEWFHCHPFDAVDAVERCIRRGVPLEVTFAPADAAAIRERMAA